MAQCWDGAGCWCREVGPSSVLGAGGKPLGEAVAASVHVPYKLASHAWACVTEKGMLLFTSPERWTQAKCPPAGGPRQVPLVAGLSNT